ncbi:MAG: trypsin-like peptidase domain-containing protein, partial [Alphaproteobacteria bacterium]|nr:trypsin-like peptidase domain-containing protein [Alphaproteobacteria bacterium]
MGTNRHKRFPRKLRPTVAVVATAVLAGGAVALAAIDAPIAEPSRRAAAPAGLPASFSQIIARISPAVVNVQVERKVAELSHGERHRMPGEMRRFLERFFEDDRFGGREFRFAPRPRGPGLDGVGSGFIVDADGLIVTNDHVVRGADKITVTTEAGRRYLAELVGRDPKTDLALLKIDGADMPAVRFAARDADVGDWVIAIGNPFGLGHSATTGIVSARHRSIGAGPYDDFLQIDAPVNRGNSGGPVFNVHGEVVGVNAAIFSPTGGSVGIAFAIPASLARDVVADLEDDGKVARGWLGVQIQRVDEDRPRGAIVAAVVAGGPAAAAGLEPGDVILGVNGAAVETMRELPRRVAALPAGEAAELDLWRDGRATAATVEIGALPTGEDAAARSAPAVADGAPGLALAPLDERARGRFGIDDAVEGAVVTRVERGSDAAAMGLRPGDVVVGVAGTAVTTPAEVA